MNTAWMPASEDNEIFNGRDRKTHEIKMDSYRADLIFGSNSELRALSEVHGSADTQEKLVKDFVAAWD